MVSSEDTNGTLDDKEESTEETDGTLENDNVVDEEDADAEIESEDTDNSSTDLDEVTDEPEEESTSEQVEQESEVQPTIATFSAAQKSLKGIALKSPTNVYQKQDKNSKVLKSYALGSVLQYKTFTTEWYEATVYLNGKAHTGYIHKNDVENSTSQQRDLIGIGLNNSTHVYKSTSTSSGILKSYAMGSILRYKTFTNNWYEATVIVNGKKHTGYIHKSHVENAVEKQKDLRGIGLKVQLTFINLLLLVQGHISHMQKVRF
ncbi:SH3 domain-containing protein [Paracerasibacillus soli]|uniref:SH3 domain-containing protein n=1 Tax=Paracerasibacillus soli TaxID=480284 RepID=A0ABU5CUD0_9BACI|nr:hypothetical protein [Virgibacillus soli]MDY0409439.1 hypothetical protein [Virgibacillus soli]